MNTTKVIHAFSALGEYMNSPENIPSELCSAARQKNNWFTEESVRLSILGIASMLTKDNLQAWSNRYILSSIKESKGIGIVMAGNIPLVGFTDFLAIMMTGHIAKIKLSSQDDVILPFLIDKLLEFEPELGSQIQFTEQLKEIDAIIATGSDNTSRYFEHYFGKYPNIIRKNRSSCAIINGNETPEEINSLGKDIFTYYGLGCRNVSKVYLPEEYDIKQLISNLESHKQVIDHHKYNNNYDYNKSIYLVNRVNHYDNGFLLLTENEGLVSPISVLYYEYYKDANHLNQLIIKHQDKIQCIVSKGGWYADSVAFGQAQHPTLMDYADNLDVMEFLISLD